MGIPKLYTRGNGYYGQSIDHLIRYLKLPKYDKENNITIRGELIIKEETFKEKYGKTYANSRNFVAGLVNQKYLTEEKIEMIKDIDFVGYEVIFPRNKKASEQFNYLKSLDKELIVVEHIVDIREKQLTNQFLSEKLLELREKYEYTIDGIIVSVSYTHLRAHET